MTFNGEKCLVPNTNNSGILKFSYKNKTFSRFCTKQCKLQDNFRYLPPKAKVLAKQKIKIKSIGRIYRPHHVFFICSLSTEVEFIVVNPKGFV